MSVLIVDLKAEIHPILLEKMVFKQPIELNSYLFSFRIYSKNDWLKTIDFS